MTLGAGANVRDQKIGALCSSPVEVATHQTFFILMPIMKGPPEGPGCHYKDPNATVQGIRAAAFLFFQWICSIYLVREGEEGYSIRLRIPGGEGGRLHWPWALPSRNSEVLVPMFFLQTTYYVNHL